MIEADLPAVLALDQRCFGGLWTRSGYQREIDSEQSVLHILVSTQTPELIYTRLKQPADKGIGAQAIALDMDTESPGGTSSSSLSLIGVGCLWAILTEAHITTLAIEPIYQGKRLGLFLLTHLLIQAHRRGLTHATLEVRASNQRALSLYQKLGFQEAGERKRYYSDGESAKILWQSQLETAERLAQIQRHQTSAIASLKTAGFFNIAKPS